MKPAFLSNSRRNFLKKCSLSALPFALPSLGFTAVGMGEPSSLFPENSNQKPIHFISDGLFFSPKDYLQKLQEINAKEPIEPDFYGNGGATTALEKKFAELTGKEKAMYLPTGTMANQLAMKLLNGNKTKVIVPENSHVFRDEADAAQSVHRLRLIPIGKDKSYYDVADLKETVNYTLKEEVFQSGLGTVVLENPVRRTDNTFIPLSVIKEISAYCKETGYKLHLDGARIHLASAYSGVSVKTYSSLFDTVYISLYKYLNAAGGAILCGDAELIDQLGHQMKILGGTTFQSWMNTGMALHYLEDIDKRWELVTARSQQLINTLNNLKGVSVELLKHGSNTFYLKLEDTISAQKLGKFLQERHAIWIGRVQSGKLRMTVNESILNRSIDHITSAWEAAIKQART